MAASECAVAAEAENESMSVQQYMDLAYKLLSQQSCASYNLNTDAKVMIHLHVVSLFTSGVETCGFYSELVNLKSNHIKTEARAS